MGKTEKAVAPATTEAPKKERKILTPAERVAKLEAELAAARAKAEARENKAKAEASEKQAKLIAKRDELNQQIAALNEVIGRPADAGVTTEAPVEDVA